MHFFKENIISHLNVTIKEKEESEKLQIKKNSVLQVKFLKYYFHLNRVICGNCSEKCFALKDLGFNLLMVLLHLANFTIFIIS